MQTINNISKVFATIFDESMTFDSNQVQTLIADAPIPNVIIIECNYYPCCMPCCNNCTCPRCNNFCCNNRHCNSRYRHCKRHCDNNPQ